MQIFHDDAYTLYQVHRWRKKYKVLQKATKSYEYITDPIIGTAKPYKTWKKVTSKAEERLKGTCYWGTLRPEI